MTEKLIIIYIIIKDQLNFYIFGVCQQTFNINVFAAGLQNNNDNNNNNNNNNVQKPQPHVQQLMN